MRLIRMPQLIDTAYALAESAIEDNDYEHFKDILKEVPNLDIYNGPINSRGIRTSWSQPLLGIAIENENTHIVDIILALENYKITKPLNYEDSESKMTALAYAEKIRNQRQQESSGSDPHYMDDINYIFESLSEKFQKQNGGNRRRSYRNRKSRRNRRNRKSRSTTSRRRRH